MPQPDRERLLRNMRIPTLPVMVQRLTQMIDDPNAGAADVGLLIKEDPPLAGKVLRIANSSFYGLSERCTSIEKASTVLGLRSLRSVVVQAALIQAHDHLDGMGLDLEQLWRRSVLTGHISSILARRARCPLLPSPDDAYLSGLLHDIGQVVLLDNLSQEYMAIHEESQRHKIALHLVERRDLGMTHADVGAIVANSWGLPNVVRSGIEFHHGRRASDYLIPAVYLAIRSGQIVDRVSAGALAAASEPIDEEAEKAFGVTPQAVTEAIEHVRTNLNLPLEDAA